MTLPPPPSQVVYYQAPKRRETAVGSPLQVGEDQYRNLKSATYERLPATQSTFLILLSLSEKASHEIANTHRSS
jgi:hypothetical protein